MSTDLTLDYDAETNSVTIILPTGTRTVPVDWDPGWPDENDLTITESFCDAAFGHSYAITGRIHTYPSRKRRECRICGKMQVESPSTWTDV